MSLRPKIATNPAKGVWFQQKPTSVTIAYFLYFWLVWPTISCSNVNIIKIKWTKLHQVCEKAFRESQRKFNILRYLFHCFASSLRNTNGEVPLTFKYMTYATDRRIFDSLYSVSTWLLGTW